MQLNKKLWRAGADRSHKEDPPLLDLERGARGGRARRGCSKTPRPVLNNKVLAIDIAASPTISAASSSAGRPQQSRDCEGAEARG